MLYEPIRARKLRDQQQGPPLRGGVFQNTGRVKIMQLASFFGVNSRVVRKLAERVFFARANK